MVRLSGGRTPGGKFLLAILIGLALSIPLFSVWLLVYDRQSQFDEATASITQGWGGPQAVTGPLLVIPYRATATELVVEGNRQVSRSRQLWRELILAPEVARLDSSVDPELRRRSIYQAVVYEARVAGAARFAFPPDLERFGVAPGDLDLARAELRFGLSDPRGLGSNPRVAVGGRPLRLHPGSGSGGGRGFFAWLDASSLPSAAIRVDFSFGFRGNAALSLAPQAGDTVWRLRSAWPHPSFGGDFLPTSRTVGDKGFSASYRIGNLALGRALVSTGDVGAPSDVTSVAPPEFAAPPNRFHRAPGAQQTATVSLMQPVDLYSRVNRATKYGFLFIGFTFLALLMFDVIGGVRVSAVEYLLMGAALVLFFVLLLALAEVIGFAAAYVLAAGAVAALNTLYSAAVLGSWRRALVIGSLLAALYAVLYVLLSLEAYSLLIGSLLLFSALAGVMYATRRLDWSAAPEPAAAEDLPVATNRG